MSEPTPADRIEPLPPGVPLPAPGERRFRVPGLETFGRLIALVLVFAFFAILVPDRSFLKPGNIEDILRQSAVYATAALGMTMVIITAGIDLSVGSTIALTTVTVAYMLNLGLDPTVPGDKGLIHDWPILLPIVAVLAAVAMATLMGALNGLMIVALRLVPFIVTLGMMGIIRGVAKGIADQRTVYVMEDVWIKDIMRATLTSKDPSRSWMLLPPGVWLLIVAAVFAALLLRYTRLGRHIFAVGSNPETARLCGVPVGRTTIIVYALAGMFGGLAGLMEFAYGNGIGEPTGAIGYELYVIAAVVIGGGQLHGRRGLHPRRADRRADHHHPQDRRQAGRLAAMGPGNRHRRDHHRRRRPRPVATQGQGLGRAARARISG